MPPCEAESRPRPPFQSNVHKPFSHSPPNRWFHPFPHNCDCRCDITCFIFTSFISQVCLRFSLIRCLPENLGLLLFFKQGGPMFPSNPRRLHLPRPQPGSYLSSTPLYVFFSAAGCCPFRQDCLDGVRLLLRSPPDPHNIYRLFLSSLSQAREDPLFLCRQSARLRPYQRYRP